MGLKSPYAREPKLTCVVLYSTLVELIMLIETLSFLLLGESFFRACSSFKPFNQFVIYFSSTFSDFQKSNPP